MEQKRLDLYLIDMKYIRNLAKAEYNNEYRLYM